MILTLLDIKGRFIVLVVLIVKRILCWAKLGVSIIILGERLSLNLDPLISSNKLLR